MSQRNDRATIKKFTAVCGGVLAPLVLPIFLGRIFSSIRWIDLRGENFVIGLAVGLALLAGELLVATYPTTPKMKIWLVVGYALIAYPALLMVLLWFQLEVLQIKIA